MARPTKYKVEYATMEFIMNYVANTINNGELVSLCSLAVYMGVCEDTLQEWRKVYPAFSVSLGIVKQKSKNMLINKGLDSTYNSTITKLMLSSNHGMAERTETQHSLDKPTATLLGLIDGNSKGKLPTKGEEDA